MAQQDDYYHRLTDYFMRQALAVFLLVSAFIGLNACAVNPNLRVPLPFSMTLIDIPCEDVTNSIPDKLEAVGFSFRWKDKEHKFLIVGPIIKSQHLGKDFYKIRQTFFLNILCHTKLITIISGDVFVEGLKSNGKWIAIRNPLVIEQLSEQFFSTVNF